jgi:hypothetical protein
MLFEPSQPILGLLGQHAPDDHASDKSCMLGDAPLGFADLMVRAQRADGYGVVRWRHDRSV